jgi:hypothetical protein
MAFTTPQETQIRKWLGFPALFRFRDVRLESAITIVGGDVDASAEVVTVLGALAVLDADIISSVSMAGIKQADEVQFFEGKSKTGTALTDAQQRQGRMLCSRLSTLFGVPLANDAFGTKGYSGDWWMGAQFQGSGGVTPLG